MSHALMFSFVDMLPFLLFASYRLEFQLVGFLTVARVGQPHHQVKLECQDQCILQVPFVSFFFFFWEQEKDKSWIGKSCKIIKGVWEWNGSFGACKEDCNCGERERGKQHKLGREISHIVKLKACLSKDFQEKFF
jgi:hypothetical protein